MKKTALVFFLLVHFLAFQSHAQGEKPFVREINYFKKLDSLNPPPANPILFIGSSSFTNWKDVKSYFPDYPILNRGFGGSSLPHLVLYANDVIFAYTPKQIVIYCGESDLTSGPNIRAKDIRNRFVKLYKLIRAQYPKTPILYISMKPSPSRQKYLATMKKGNKLIRRYLRHKKNSQFLDVFTHMLNADGSIRSDIFLDDQLHMNAKGYAIWQPLIEPYLRK